jgi:hypothetical protein
MIVKIGIMVLGILVIYFGFEFFLYALAAFFDLLGRQK